MRAFSRFWAPWTGILGLLAAPKAFAQEGGAGNGFLRLLEPIGSCNVSTTNMFFGYINCLYPWVMGVAAGLCVLYGIWGGLTMINSGGDQAKYSGATNKIMAAVVGLLILLFASVILQTINPLFFRPGL
ncbi:MAG: hypothetical protein WCV62_04985 [Candidatus Peribacteraceae bacterium]|jgi:hypothetical protein